MYLGQVTVVQQTNRFIQTLVGDRQVGFRGAEAPVAEKRLHIADAAPAVEDIGGKLVAQTVRMKRRHAGLGRPGGEEAADGLVRYTEEAFLRWLTLCEGLQAALDVAVEVNGAVFAALALQHDEMGRLPAQSQVPYPEMGQFSQPQAGMVEQLDDEDVALDEALVRFAARYGRLELLHLFVRDLLWHRLGGLDLEGEG
jgi:hypothetical protein